MKLYFESAPVSRSQAKRLCARLEGFREVSLDFADVEWIGQGFADQVFRVFQNENPEIRLLPLNMNRDVGRMYYHVTGKKPGLD
ncbi:MAG: STAS-like domain-containing protein [Clostridia bacterium]|nr:STAS-like domain-containing protein [Clostridia bacterium]